MENNKIKVDKPVFIMAIVSASITFAYMLVVTLSMYIPNFTIVEPFKTLLQYHESNSFVLVASLVVFVTLIFEIFFPKKGIAVTNIIFSFASMNILSAVTSIMLIVNSNRKNEEIERIERQKQRELAALNGEVVDEDEFVQKRIQKKEITHVEYDESMQTKLMVGIGIASIYLILIGAAYYGVIYGLSICFGPNASESQTWGGLYLMFLFILLIFPLAIEIINITITAFALHDKKVRTAKLMRVFGIVSLTFINANVAREALRNAYTDTE